MTITSLYRTGKVGISVFQNFRDFFNTWHCEGMNDNDKCELAYELTYYGLYRTAQFYTFIVSFFAVFALLYFIFRKLVFSPFHCNLKVLLISYFGMLMAFSFTVAVTFGHHAIQPFFAMSRCDLILNKNMFKWFHILILFTMTTPMLLQVAISIERVTAVIMVQQYERVRIGIGPVLVVIVICTNIYITYLIYKDEKFEEVFISFLLTPMTSANQLNNFFWFLLYLDIANFLVNVVLFRVIHCIKRKYRKIGNLSIKYEIEEIILSTKFTLSFQFVHLLTIGCYLSVILTVRTLGQNFFNGYINYATARGAFVTVPTYSLIVVFISIQLLNKFNNEKIEKSKKSVHLEYAGPEGTRNHYDAIFSVWNSVSNGKVDPCDRPSNQGKIRMKKKKDRERSSINISSASCSVVNSTHK